MEKINQTGTLTLAEIKQILGDPGIDDEMARQVRDTCQGLVDLALEVWKSSRNKKTDKKQH